MPRPARGYDEEDIQRGLTEVALCAGNYSEAARRLAERGLGISAKTLREWRVNYHSERYERLRAELEDKLYDEIAEQTESLLREQAEVEHKLVAKLSREVEDIPSRDLPGAVRNMATSRGISTDKSMSLRQRPQVVIEHRADPQAIFDKLADKYPDAVIDTTGEEIKEDKKALPSSSVG